MFLLCLKVYFVLSYVAVFFIVKWLSPKLDKENEPFVSGCALVVSPLSLVAFAIFGCVYCGELICKNVGELFFGQPPTNKGEEDVN